MEILDSIIKRSKTIIKNKSLHSMNQELLIIIKKIEDKLWLK